MILSRPLEPAERRRSQFNFNCFSAVNGLSYMCLGETVMILLAVQLGCPDYVSSTLGAMLYAGFLLLPLGKIVTARVGAARAQEVFWICRNGAALMVASATLWYFLGWDWAATAALLVGAFFFYGFRAAGVVMSQPLLGDITTDEERPRMIGLHIGVFYLCGLVSLMVISAILHWNSGMWVLTSMVVVGAFLGLIASRFLHRMVETDAVMRSARLPIMRALPRVWRNPTMRRLLAAGLVVNLGCILFVPVSMLALKKGLEVSDAEALWFAIAQFLGCAVVSFGGTPLASVVGPRRVLLYCFGIFSITGVMWMLVDAQYSGVYMAVIFFLLGMGMTGTNNSTMHYFLQSIPPRNRVASSVLLSVVGFAGAGLLGMVVAGVMLKYCDTVAVFNGCEEPLAGYIVYFEYMTLLTLPGLWVIARLRPLPKDRRSLKKSWLDFILK